MPFYNNHSNRPITHFGERIAKAEAESRWKKILEHLPEKQGSVLEIGPGRGYVASWLQENSRLRYVAVDVNKNILESISSIGVLAWVPPLPFQGSTFNVSYASHVLEHMANFREALLFLEEMQRVVVHGGLVCCVTPDFRASPFHFWNVDYSHSFPLTPRRLVQIYQDVGLEIVALYAASGPIIGKLAFPLGVLARLLPSWIVGDGTWINKRFVKMWYSLKTTFLPSLFIIGRKVK